MQQRKQPNTHRLWSKHPAYPDGWATVHTGTQAELEIEKRIRGLDTRASFKILPIGEMPSDLEEV